jgi:hypothetical protein
MRISNARACAVGLAAIAASWVVGDRARRVIEETNGAIEETRLSAAVSDRAADETRRKLAALSNAYLDARRRLHDFDVVIAAAEEQGVGRPRPPPLPRIDAEVVDVLVDVQTSLVLLSVGSNKKVEQGHRFFVYRGSELIGRVEVEEVFDAACAARVLFTKTGLSIQPGDVAATRLE